MVEWGLFRRTVHLSYTENYSSSNWLFLLVSWTGPVRHICRYSIRKFLLGFVEVFHILRQIYITTVSFCTFSNYCFTNLSVIQRHRCHVTNSVIKYTTNINISLSLHRAFCSSFNSYTNKCTYIHLMV